MNGENWRKSTYSSGQGGNCVEVASWRKSSYSSGQGGQCVEVASWRKSTFSGGEGGQCVEVADLPGIVAVRDTANRDGCTLRVPAAAWLTLLAKIRG